MSDLTKLADEVRDVSGQSKSVALNLDSLEREAANLVRQVQAVAREGVSTGALASVLENAIGAIAGAKHGLAIVQAEGENYANILAGR